MQQQNNELQDYSLQHATVCRFCEKDCGSFEMTMRHQEVCSCKDAYLAEKLNGSETIALARNKNLLEIMIRELELDLVGQELEKRIVCLAIASTLIINPKHRIHILFNAASSSGKSYFMRSVMKLLPEELFEYRLRISPQTFQYWHNVLNKGEEDWTWNGKVCFLEDVTNNVLNGDALKIMLSEGGGKASIVYNGKAFEYETRGKPVVIMTTATSVPIAELENRLVIVHLNESEEQTREINRSYARKVSSGIEEKQKYIVSGIFNYLKPVRIKILYLEAVVEYFPVFEPRARRDFPRLVSFIMSSAALHQMNRECIDGYIIANEEDYENARMAFEGIVTMGTLGLTHEQIKAYNELGKIFEIYEKGESDDSDDQDKRNRLVLGAGLTAMEIYKVCPTREERNWRDMLSALAKKKLVKIDERKNERNQTVLTYRPINKTNPYSLPTFEVIKTKLSELSKTSSSSSSSSISSPSSSSESSQISENRDLEQNTCENVGESTPSPPKIGD